MVSPESRSDGGWVGLDEGPRFLFYSHDSWGLGHLRRSLTLATALTEALPGASALIATGSPCATHFLLPERVDLVKLPAVSKDSEGGYQPRSLGLTLAAVLELRRRLLLETLRAFAPDAVIVDHQVAGLAGEMVPVLKEAGARGALRVLGLRDVIDSPEAVARNWDSPACNWALERGYDEVCVYGCPEVFDPRLHYPLPLPLRSKLWFSGYVVRPAGPRALRPVPSLRPRVLVTMGGGEDGAGRIERYLEAVSLAPTAWETTIVTGPLMEARLARQIKRRARLLGSIEVRRFHADLPGLLQEADAVVAMAGYNTCAEILQSGRPAILLPRTTPREEQRIRAESLDRLGLVESLVEPSARVLREAIEAALSDAPIRPRRPDLRGSRNFSSRVRALVDGGALAQAAPAGT